MKGNMEVRELINYAFMEATGKNTEIDEGSPKYLRLLKIANLMADQWQNEPGVEWKSRKKMISIGSIEPNKHEYSIPENVLKLDRLSGRKIEIRKNNNIIKSIDVRDVKTIGGCLDMGDLVKGCEGEIWIPIIEKLPKMESMTDKVLVDNPKWLVFMTAAEFARNDMLKGAQYGNIVAYAQNLMEGMKRDNNSLSYDEFKNARRGGVF